MKVAIITVGDELLRGETVNTNAAWLARQLSERDVSVDRMLVVPDDEAVILNAIKTYRHRYDAVLLTGGLGPTPDDVTMEAIAHLTTQLFADHPAIDDIARAMREKAIDALPADVLPEGIEVLENPVGYAPGVILDGIYVLPGVPDEMKAIFGQVLDEFTGERRFVETIQTDTPERELSELLEEALERFEVAVGSYPDETVTIRISGSNKDTVREATAWLEDQVSTDQRTK